MAIKRRFKHRWVGIVLNVVIGFFGTVVLVFGIFLIYASATTLKANSVEKLKVYGNSSKELHTGESINMLSWNVGYCALDETADFFMDGGADWLFRYPKGAK
jgi:hypothetical protein